MNKPSIFILCLTFAGAVSAREEMADVIEVLAPKQSLTMASSPLATEDFDDRLNNQLNRTVADQLATVSGVSLMGQGGQFQSYAIRGFSRARIRTEIDGIPIITDRRAGNSISFIAPELFSQIQVLKGPSSAVYGSQAMGGVVNLSSEVSDGSSLSLQTRPDTDFTGISFKHGENNTGVALAYQRENNGKSATGTELNTQFERLSAVVRHQFEQGEQTVTLSWLPSVGQDIGKSNSKYQVSEISSYPEELHSLAQIQIQSQQDWLFKLFHHYQNWDSETQRFDQYTALTHYQSHTLGGQWLAQYNAAGVESYYGVDWLSRAGVNIQSQYLDLDTSTGELNSQDLNASEDNLAIYSKHQWQGELTLWSLSLRYDHITQKAAQQQVDEQALSVSSSANINLAPDLKIAFELASGFRYPTLSERFFNGSTPRGLVEGQQNLKPEKSLGLQTNFSWWLNESLQLNGAFYYYRLDNYIERYRINADTRSYRNLDRAAIHGYEFEANWYATPYLEHKLSYQQQRGRDQNHRTLDDLTPAKLSLSSFVNLSEFTVSNAFNYYFSPDSVGPSESKRGSYSTWDVSLSYQLTREISAVLVLNNLTDRVYYGSLDEDAPEQLGRSAKLALHWQF